MKADDRAVGQRDHLWVYSTVCVGEGRGEGFVHLFIRPAPESLVHCFPKSLVLHLISAPQLHLARCS